MGGSRKPGEAVIRIAKRVGARVRAIHRRHSLYSALTRRAIHFVNRAASASPGALLRLAAAAGEAIAWRGYSLGTAIRMGRLFAWRGFLYCVLTHK